MLVVVVRFGRFGNEQMDLACVSLFQVRRVNGSFILRESQPDAQVSPSACKQWAEGNDFGVNDRVAGELRLGEINRLERHSADRAYSRAGLQYLRVHRA